MRFGRFQSAFEFNIELLVRSLEKYSRGRRGAPAKGIGRVTGARVQIPLSPLGRIKLTTIWLRAFSMGFLKLVMKSYLLKASQG